jgi:hypothetical protein
MRLLKLSIFLLIFSFLTCNKEDEPRIIEPGSYFPVYPGSWWKYTVNDTISIKDSTGEDYILHLQPPENSEQVYVPVFYAKPGSPVSINGPVFKYDKIINYPKRGPGSQLWPILSERIGFSFSVTPYDVTHAPYEEKATVQEKLFNGRDSVLIITGHFEDIYGRDTFPLLRHREFIKNVGLSLNVLIDTVSMDTVYKGVLTEYHINR